VEIEVSTPIQVSSAFDLEGIRGDKAALEERLADTNAALGVTEDEATRAELLGLISQLQEELGKL
jgi:hypothetical protein